MSGEAPRPAGASEGRAAPSHVVVARPGSAVMGAVAAAVVQAKGGRPLAPVTVVAPSGIGLVRFRRELAAELGRVTGGVAALQVTTVAALAAGGGAGGRAPASRLAVVAAVARAAAEQNGAFAATAHEPATALALAGAYRELRAAGDGALDALATRGRGARELAAVCRRATQLLRTAGLADDADRLANADVTSTDALVVVVDGHLAADAVELLRRAAPSTAAVRVVAVGVDDPAADAAVLAVARRLAGEPAGAAAPADTRPNAADVAVAVSPIGAATRARDSGARVGALPGGLAAPPAIGTTLVVHDATDPDAEVRDVVRALRAAIAAGADPARCALVWTADDPYRRLVTEHLDRAGLPWTGPAGGNLAETAAGRAVLAASGDIASAAASWQQWAASLAGTLAGTRTGTVVGEDDPVLAVVTELARLDRVDGFPQSPRVRRSRTTALLELALGSTAPRRTGRGVLVGSLDGLPSAPGFDVVAVVGAAEGWLPRPPAAGLLPGADRVAAGLPSDADEAAAQRRRLLATVQCAREAHASWPRGDLRRTVERQPSRLLAELGSAGSVDHVHRDTQPSQLRALLTGPAASPADARLATAIAAPGDLAVADRAFARAAAAATARRLPQHGAYDGHLVAPDAGAVDLGALARVRPWTATELEAHLDCPRTYFVRHVLRVRDAREIDELLAVDPREEGTLLHDAMYLALASETASPSTTRAQVRVVATNALAEAEARAELARSPDRSPRHGAAPTAGDAVARRSGGAPQLLRANRRRQHLAALVKLLDNDRIERAKSGRSVVRLESTFGEDDAVELPLPDGRMLAVRGRFDRVDRTADGAAVVVDYKRSVHTEGDHPLGGRGRLQVGLYAAVAALADDVSEASGELVALRKASVAAVPASMATDATAAVATIVTAIEAGWFVPPRHEQRAPGQPLCNVCDPYGLFERVLAARPEVVA